MEDLKREADEHVEKIKEEIKVLNPECKKKIHDMLEKFKDSPLNETPSWNTYLATKQVTEPLDLDSYDKLNIIEYNSLNKKLRIIRSYNPIHLDKIRDKIENDI